MAGSGGLTRLSGFLPCSPTHIFPEAGSPKLTSCKLNGKMQSFCMMPVNSTEKGLGLGLWPLPVRRGRIYSVQGGRSLMYILPPHHENEDDYGGKHIPS